MSLNPRFETVSFRGKKHSYFFVDIGRPRFNEVDSYKVVWNGHFLNYFETARLELCRHFEFDLEKLSQLGCYLPVHKYQINMKKPIFLDDTVRVGVRPAEFSDGLYEFFHILMVGNEIRAYGSVQHVAMDKATLSVTTGLPQNVLALLNQLYEKFEKA